MARRPAELLFAIIWLLPALAWSQVTPTVTITATDATASELGPDTGTFTFTRSGGNIGAALTVFVTKDVTTTVGGADYSDNTGGFFESFSQVPIPAGSASFDLVITPEADNIVEGDEQLDITLAANAAYVVGTPDSAGMTISDDAAIITVTASDAVVSELGPDTGTFTFTRSGGDISAALTVFVTKDVTTTVGGADYSDNTGGFFESFGQVPIPAGSASFDLVITPEADNIAEGDEQLDITLVANAAYVVGTPDSAGMTISDDAAIITVTASDAVVSELGPDTGTFTFTRSGGDISAALTVFVTKDVTTTVGGADYSDNTGGFFESFGQVPIPAGSASFDLVITPEADNIAEGDEQLDITLVANAAYVVGTPDSAGMTISDDAAIITVTASDAVVSELGPDTGTFTFTRSGGDISAALTVFVTKDVTTTVGGADYSDNTGGFFESFGQVPIPAGSASFDLVITPEADNIAEGDEQLDITLVANAAYVVGTPDSAGMTISDDAAIITVTASDAVASERGPGTGTFTFTRSGGDISAALTIFVTKDGTTTVGGADYSDNTGGFFESFGQVPIPAGSASFDLIITPEADNIVEGDEVLDITVAENAAYIIGSPASASMTIEDFVELIFSDGFE